MTQNSRDKILNKLRSVRRPFRDAPPRPNDYLPVTDTPDDLLERFRAELDLLRGEVFVVDGDDAARETVLRLLAAHDAKRIAAWHFKHIPVKRLHTAIKDAGYAVDYPRIHDEDRAAELDRLETATVGLTGADAAAATTGTLVFSTGEGKSRIPTVLPPVHIAVITLDQIVPQLEDWLKRERLSDAPAIHNSAHICLISGPSRTADIEKQLVLGVHGPGLVQVVVKR